MKKDMKKDNIANKKILTGLLFSAVVLVGLVACIPAVAAQPIVSIQDAIADPGQTVTVPINITGITDLATVNIWLLYNKDVVNVDSVTKGDLGGITVGINNTMGVTKMNWFSITGKTGDFVFANVTLKAVGSAGQQSALDLDVKELTDPRGKPITHTVQDGMFNIPAPPPDVNLTVEGKKYVEKVTTPSVNATYLLTVKNIGDAPDNFSLNVTNVNNADVAVLSKTLVSLAAGDSENLTLNVTDALAGDYIVNVTATSEKDPTKSDTISTKTTVVEVIINEIMYNPSAEQGSDPDMEWVELYNKGTEAVNINGWMLDRRSITPGAIMQPGGYLVIARNETAFEAYYTDVDPAIVLDGVFSLENTRDTIILEDSSGIEIDNVTYIDDWGADGNGKTLELNVTRGWEESIVDGGTPGDVNSVRYPTVTVLYPNGGEVIRIGEMVNVSANATDDVGVVNVTFYYSEDGGATWDPTPIGVASEPEAGTTDIWNVTWNTSGLNASDQYLVKANATDGVLTAEDASDGTFTLKVIITIPGQASPPTDPDGDGIYDDMNGNGKMDFNDVVVFFNNMEWIEANQPIPYFDFNDNGLIDFDDIVILFEKL